MIRRVEKPWGHEIIWAHTDRYAGKVLFIRRGERLSLQYHRRKDETIYVIAGELELAIEENGGLTTRRLAPGEACHIPAGVRHRMIAATDCQVAEASSPELDDVVRLEDVYGRAEAPAGNIGRAEAPAGNINRAEAPAGDAARGETPAAGARRPKSPAPKRRAAR